MTEVYLFYRTEEDDKAEQARKKEEDSLKKERTRLSKYVVDLKRDLDKKSKEVSDINDSLKRRKENGKLFMTNSLGQSRKIG